MTAPAVERIYVDPRKIEHPHWCTAHDDTSAECMTAQTNDLIRHVGYPEAFTASEDEGRVQIRRIRIDSIVDGARLAEERRAPYMFELTVFGDDGDTTAVCFAPRDWELLTSMVQRITRWPGDFDWPANRILDLQEQELEREREIAARNRAYYAAKEQQAG